MHRNISIHVTQNCKMLLSKVMNLLPDLTNYNAQFHFYKFCIKLSPKQGIRADNFNLKQFKPRGTRKSTKIQIKR